MITASGVHIQKVGGAQGTPTNRDIAIHAGRICRFGGAVWYTLLPHLVFVGLLAYRRSRSIPNMLWGFLHDAHEIATMDVPRPFKCDCMRTEQAAIDKRIAEKFWLTRGIDLFLIKQCDEDACDIEAMALNIRNYEEVGRDGSPVHKNKEDEFLFRRIISKGWNGVDTVFGENYWAVREFTAVLQDAEFQDHAAVMSRVRKWGLLNAEDLK
ncbi:MAG: hypothetical protein ABL984_05365 [Pyrinomonadaceae bacterium]